MDPRREHELLLTRRQFSAARPPGIGTAALASLLNPQRSPGRQARGGLRTARSRRCTSPPKAKRVIYLFMSGGAVAPRPVRLQAEAAGASRQGPARLDPHGPADHRHDLAARSRFPCVAADVQVRPARQVRRVGQRAAAAHGDDRRRHLPSSSRCTPRRSTTTRPSRSSRPAAQQPGRPSIGVVAQLRPRQREREPAGVRRHDLAGHRQQRPTSRSSRRLWGSGFLPSSIRACSSAPAATRSCTSSNPPGIDRASRRADARRPRRAQPDGSARRSATPRSHTRIAQYEMAFRMQTSRAGADRPLARSRKHVSRCTAPTSHKPGTFAAQLPARPPPGRARRPLRPALPPRLGPARQPADAASASQCQRRRPAAPPP